MPKVTLLPSKKNDFIYFNKSRSNMWEKLSIFKIFKACPDYCGHVGKQLDNKPMLHFKICDVTEWDTNNY